MSCSMKEIINRSLVKPLNFVSLKCFSGNSFICFLWNLSFWIFNGHCFFDRWFFYRVVLICHAVLKQLFLISILVGVKWQHTSKPCTWRSGQICWVWRKNWVHSTGAQLSNVWRENAGMNSTDNSLNSSEVNRTWSLKFQSADEIAA